MSTELQDLHTPHDHLVSFYEDEAQIVSDVALFVAQGLLADESVVIVATQAHRDAIDAHLAEIDLDVEALRDEARYVPLDARETLNAFMSGSSPDAALFRDVVGGVIGAAAKTGRRVRAFGEMVALLWDDGNVQAAIDLEWLWNALADEHSFVLFCAYPLRSMLEGDLAAVTHVCASHSELLPPASYNTFATRDGDAAVDESSRIFVPVVSAINASRAFVAEKLEAWDAGDITADAQIAMSELATNVVTHTRSAFRVTVSRRDDAIRLAVQDLDMKEPISPVRSADTIGGLGLVLVEGLCTSWGTEYGPDGKLVWCEFAR
jgi:anti-sigma regulatory factor (Ser/Thr protein kinase)